MWAVRLKSDAKHAYGPFTSGDEATGFAEFLSAEVDPAEVLPLLSPVGELLSWRKAMALGDAG